MSSSDISFLFLVRPDLEEEAIAGVADVLCRTGSRPAGETRRDATGEIHRDLLKPMFRLTVCFGIWVDRGRTGGIKESAGCRAYDGGELRDPAEPIISALGRVASGTMVGRSACRVGS